MFTSSILTKTRSVLNQKFGSEHQRIVSSVLYDDNVKVLTTFDMNKIASLTFGEMVCGDIFDMLEYTVRTPIEFTPLSIQKTLVLIQHLVTYGSETSVNTAWGLRDLISPLREYNTVLLSQSNPNSLNAYLEKLKGGSVERGQPVRDAAKALYDLLSDSKKIHHVRKTNADPNSLVPVGSHEDVAFVTDDVRHAMLQDRIQEEQNRRIALKSNLKKGEGGYGGGYNPANGQRNVVGAAHSIEEMLEMANKRSKRYSDNGPGDAELESIRYVEKLKEEVRRKKMNGDELFEGMSNNTGAGSSTATDKNDSNNGNAVVVDLLDLYDGGSNHDTSNSSGAGGGDIPPYPVGNKEPSIWQQRKVDPFDSFNPVANTASTAGSTAGGNGIFDIGPIVKEENTNTSKGMDLLDMMGDMAISATSTTAVSQSSPSDNPSGPVNNSVLGFGGVNVDQNFGKDNNSINGDALNLTSIENDTRGKKLSIMGGNNSARSSVISALDLLPSPDQNPDTTLNQNQYSISDDVSSTHHTNTSTLPSEGNVPPPPMDLPPSPPPSVPPSPPPPPESPTFNSSSILGGVPAPSPNPTFPNPNMMASPPHQMMGMNQNTMPMMINPQMMMQGGIGDGTLNNNNNMMLMMNNMTPEQQAQYYQQQLMMMNQHMMTMMKQMNNGVNQFQPDSFSQQNDDQGSNNKDH